jgi:hypothetical protein
MKISCMCTFKGLLHKLFRWVGVYQDRSGLNLFLYHDVQGLALNSTCSAISLLHLFYHTS